MQTAQINSGLHIKKLLCIAQRAFFEHYYNINAVPPCSLKAFIDSIADIPELCELKKLFKKALDKNKWVIHYGIWLSNNFLFEKLRKRNIEQKRNAQFLAYRELCIFVNKYF